MIWTKYQLYYAVYLDLFGKCESMFFYASWILKKRDRFEEKHKFKYPGWTSHDEIKFIIFLYE